MRDDFDDKTKLILASRVGFACSNPDCQKVTSGPQIDPSKVINIGVAAHIAAASKGGKRYDANQTPTQRKAAENGIWLCQSCSKLIDSDEKRYTVESLNQWKLEAEISAFDQLEGRNGKRTATEADPLETLLQLLEKPENWIKVQGDEYLRHRYNAQFIIKTGEPINENYNEPWTRKFPDSNARSINIEYWQGATLLKKSCFVIADGGRYTIPLPQLHNLNPQTSNWNNIQFSIDVNSLEWRTAVLFTQYASLSQVLPHVGIKLIE